MPRTARKGSPVLDIRFTERKQYYAPGETIIGEVYRKATVVSPNAIVRVSLQGRAKTKVVVQRGNSSDTYRTRLPLINERDQDNAQTLFSGPIHIPAGGEEEIWPFAICIPTHVDPRAATQVKLDQTFFPSETAQQLHAHTLPPTFQLDTSGYTEAFVEYMVTASLSLSGRSVNCVDAVAPIRILPACSDPPIADFQQRGTGRFGTIRTYELVPGVERSHLSFKQKFKQSLSTSSVPTFHFKWEVHVPTVLQLDNPTPVPFHLRVVPKWDQCSDALRGLPQKIRVTHLSMVIEARTEVKTEGTFHSHDKCKNQRTDLTLSAALFARKEPVYIPCTDEWPPINVGELLNIRLGREGRVRPRNLDQAPCLYHSFTTYNIRHKHILHWAVMAEVAGETISVNGTQLLELLQSSDERSQPEEHVQRMRAVDRSESWMQPPAEEEAPPSFQEVQKQDSKVRV